MFSGNSLVYYRNANGNRKVAGTDTRPIIDTNTNKLLNVGKFGGTVAIEVGKEMILVTPEDMKRYDDPVI